MEITKVTMFWLVTMATLSLASATLHFEEDQCYMNHDVYVQDANVRFGFMISLRKDYKINTDLQHSCAQVSRDALHNYLAVEWVVDRLNNANNGTGYIPNVKFGFYGLDDCRYPIFATRNALGFLDTHVPDVLRSCKDQGDQPLKIGIIGPSRSSTATRVVSSTRDEQLPIISMSATAAQLSDRTLYPTFFRTVPSDEHQMSMIVDILLKFSWTYTAIVYVDNEYGIFGSDLLSTKAAERGVCIQDRLKLNTSDTTSSMPTQLQDLLKKAKDNSLALVFIGDRDTAEDLIWTIDNKLQKVNGKEVKYGFHLILTDSANTDVTIYNNKNYGDGTISVATSSVNLQDFVEYADQKFKDVQSGALDHRIIKEYQRDFRDDETLFENGRHNAFVPSTVHAVFALAEAIKIEYETNGCISDPRQCEKLVTALDEGSMLNRVKNERFMVDYGRMEAGVAPDVFRQNNYTLSFDKNGDIKLVNGYQTYSIYQYRSKDKQYMHIGDYIDGKTNIDVSRIEMTKPDGSRAPSLPSSVCAKRCDSCLSAGRIPIVYREGDAYILGVFSLHDANNDDSFQCGTFRSHSNDAIVAEAFLYTIEQLRRTTGIKFGAIGIDDCYSPIRATSLLSDLFSGVSEWHNNVFQFPIDTDKLVGVVACRSSGCTIPTASFFMPLNIPVVSYAASSPDLDDRIDFPYFLRTVPSDVYQAQVMLNIVKTMGWEYIGLIYVKNNYGAKAMKAFKTLALQENSGVCVAQEIGIEEKTSDVDKRDFFTVWKKLVEQQVKVVIFIGIDVRYRHFLSYLEEEKRFGKFIFIGSEDWGHNQEILSSGPKSARGSLTLKVENIVLESGSAFRQHVAAKRPSASDTNIWFLEFWQQIFNCNFKGGFINIFDRDCEDDMQLTSDELTQLVDEQRVKHVMNAVFALGKGLHQAKNEYCEDAFPCKFLRDRTYAPRVVKMIREQKRQQDNIQIDVFDQMGNGAIGFDVYNIQQKADSLEYKYVQVGTFNSKGNNFQTQLLQFYTETGLAVEDLQSKCSEFLCDHCPKPPSKTQEDPLVEGCAAESEDFQKSDIVTISLIVLLILAVLVAALVLYLCCAKRCKALEKKIKREETIYDEPVRQPYLIYNDTHGIQFSNDELNPYVMRGPNGIASPRSLIQGMVNPTFEPDNIDSISQVVAAHPREHPPPQRGFSQPDLRSRIHQQNQENTANPYSSRPLPVVRMGSEALDNAMRDNHAYLHSPASSGVKKMSNANSNSNIDSKGLSRGDMVDDISLASTPNTISRTYISPASEGTDSNRTDPVPQKRPVGLSNEQLHVNLPNSPESYQIQDGIVYYMQGPNGQLAAHISSPVTENTVPIMANDRPVMLPQNSVISNNINPNYGPYSTAAAQRLQQLNPAALRDSYFSNMDGAVGTNSESQLSTGINAIALKEMNFPNSQIGTADVDPDIPTATNSMYPMSTDLQRGMTRPFSDPGLEVAPLYNTNQLQTHQPPKSHDNATYYQKPQTLQEQQRLRTELQLQQQQQHRKFLELQLQQQQEIMRQQEQLLQQHLQQRYEQQQVEEHQLQAQPQHLQHYPNQQGFNQQQLQNRWPHEQLMLQQQQHGDQQQQETPHQQQEIPLESVNDHQQQNSAAVLQNFGQGTPTNTLAYNIPDVVGNSTPPFDLDRQVSMDSVKLSTSRESLDDIDSDDQVASNFTNSKLRLPTYLEDCDDTRV